MTLIKDHKMEFRNLTPFPALNYKMLDIDRQEYHVVVMKVAYTLRQNSFGQYDAIVMDKDAVPLCFEDEYREGVNSSSIVMESDLAPVKPFCDVILNGTAYAPDQEPCHSFYVRMKLTSFDNDIVLDKTLNVTGERLFQRSTNHRRWRLTEPEKFTELKLDYQFAFGGECRINEQDVIQGEIESKYCLTEEQKQSHPDRYNSPKAHTVCEYNPIGRGFIEPWYADALQPAHFPAPRIESPAHPINEALFNRQLLGESDISQQPALKPCGVGIVGRSWLPRIKQAGTYDDEWLKNRHPYLPDDFDFSYWNGAPEDQQIDFPYGLNIELHNLTPQGLLITQLPQHRAFVLLRMENGSLLPLPMLLDTLLINTDDFLIYTTYRCVIPVGLSIRAMEVRFEMNPDAPVINISTPVTEEVC